jgi:cytochrome oxidase Cu insertion factor (SCO1/SenC/PrrC family)/thiol-disulfide isomerase/thioredoxin
MTIARVLRRVALALVLMAVAGLLVLGLRSRPATPLVHALADNPDLDGGTGLSGRAPGFTLTDQSGRRVSLKQFAGQVVLLAFVDSQCTTVCPLTTSEILDAKRLLGAPGARVQLLGVDANPDATSIRDVRAYTVAHEMTHQWHFLTGSLAQLRRVWGAYHIAVQIEAGEIDHTPALYVINARGRLAKLYVTEMAYAGVEQQAQLIAGELSRLLPGHPPVRSQLPYTRIPPIAPTDPARLPLTGGGSITLGPGQPSRLYLFFATWDSEVSNLAAELRQLERYASRARPARLPTPAAIDEGIVEPSAAALARFLGSLRHPLPYPVAVDSSGRVADGYGVEDQPWLVLVSSSGRILWHRDVSTSGWPSASALQDQVSAAMRRPYPTPTGDAQAAIGLAGSPPALAGLHDQAGRLLAGARGALAARLHELRGHPVVLNVWASWCTPCQREFPLFAAAAAHYGRRIAFLGADYEDSASDARSFLAGHPVSYPSYETSASELAGLESIAGVPTTIFIDAAGQVVHVHIGQYDAQGTLDQDIDHYSS